MLRLLWWWCNKLAAHITVELKDSANVAQQGITIQSYILFNSRLLPRHFLNSFTYTVMPFVCLQSKYCTKLGEK